MLPVGLGIAPMIQSNGIGEAWNLTGLHPEREPAM
jgi:hypothetical protein